MEYRQLPHGSEHEQFSVLGLGLGGIGQTPADEIEAIIRKAIDHGINFFDMCTAGATYAPFGRAIAGQREKVFLQVHFGAVYDENGEYGWCRDFETIKKAFLWELETLRTDYVDFGFLHCVDEDEDFDKLCEIGVLDYLKDLKAQGVVRHIGFSSHTPAVANRILDTGLIDMMMFSIAKLISFLNEFNKGIADEEKRAKYRQKFISNEAFRNQELEYILLLTDRYISFDKPQMLAKLYLSYLDDEIIWQEFTMYAEVVDRFLMLDCNTLTGDAEKIIVPRNIGGESVLRLVALGLMTEITETSAFVRGNNGNIGLSMEGLKKATSRNRTYKRTEFGEKLANILR